MSFVTATLADACSKITDGTHHSPPIVEKGVPYVTAKHIKEDGVKFFDDPWFVSEESHGEIYSRCDPRPGDVLYIKDGATTGVAAINEYDFPFSMLSSVALLRPDSDRLDPRFLAHWLNSPTAKWKHLRRMGGAAIKRLTLSKIKNFEIPLPPLPEQKRIAAILDAADALRAKRRASLAQLDTLLQATFLDMFGDPVTNPMSWSVSRFEDIGTSRLGKMLDKGKQTGDSQFPYLANVNVRWGSFDFSDLRQMDFDEADRKEFALRRGDVLICEGGEVGRAAIWREEVEDVYFQKALHRVRLDTHRAVPEYILHYLWFMAMNGGFRDFATSATIAHLTGVKLRRLPVPLPPLEAQRLFGEFAGHVARLKATQELHLGELDNLFASLQSRAFRGEL